MRHTRHLRAWTAAFAAAAVGLVSAVTAMSATAADTVVISSDFEDGTAPPWQARGTSIEVVDTDAHTGTRSLAVTGRSADWHGVQTDIAGLVGPGQVVTVSGWVKLIGDETTEPTTARFTINEATDGTYTQVSTPVAVDATQWVELTGTYQVPQGQAGLVLYVEAAAPTADFLVDDLTVTAGEAPPAAPVTVTAVDFDDETLGDWSASGNPALAYVDADEGKALSFTRAADYEGIQSPAGLLQSGVVYTFSMRAKLPDDSPLDSTDVRFVVKPNYNWVANTTITKDGWTQITGEYTVPSDVADLSQVQIYLGTADQEGAASYAVLVDDILVTRPAGGGSGTVVDLAFDFEDGLQGWQARNAQGAPTVTVTDAEAHGGSQAALVTDRSGQGDGIALDVTDIFEYGVSYDITAWVKTAAGEQTDGLWLSAHRVNDGADSFDTVGQFSDITSTEWTQVSASYTMAAADTALLYFEAPWVSSTDPGTTTPFLVDDIRIRSQDAPVVQDLLPIKDTVDFPLGVAIDSRETSGSAGELTLLHFNQITAENHMKVEAWYDEDRNFRMHPEAEALLDFAQDNDLRVYGHVLLWHSQTPDWFFLDEAGEPLTDSEADQEFLAERLRTHIFSVAEAISDRVGPFGSDTNPMVAWDVVNEVVSDSAEYADGLRRSEWYRILGEDFIDLAFEYADEAFNGEYAADGTDRPVKLFINDYNTEQGGKQDRYFALVSRMLERGVPLDGVGHQFHVSLSMPVSALEGALARFGQLPVVQAVTELDVTVGSPVTQANLVEQGYYYRDAFRAFRAYHEETGNLFSATIWGLYDSRSWRSEQAPLAFDSRLQAKPAYYGAIDGELPARLQAELSFRGTVDLDDDALASPQWQRLPLHAIEDVAQFQTRWESDHLTVFVQVADPTLDAADGLALTVGATTYAFGRDGVGDVDGVVAESSAGWSAVVHLPLDDATQGEDLPFDLQVTDGEQTTGWNTPGVLGTLTLVEPLSFLEVAQAPEAPAIDGEVDEAWALANVVTTDKVIEGSADGATAQVRTLWSGDGSTLYVLAEVTDPQIDLSGSDPWIQDSVEIFVDAGNVRNGPYRADDTQIRINADNVVSFGTGDEAFQQSRLTSATARTDTGYVVEAAISLLEAGGPGTFHGLDFQVNDGTNGSRTSAHMWADPTGISYQNSTRWGVGQLVQADDEEPPVEPVPTVDADQVIVTAGEKVTVTLSGFPAGAEVKLRLTPEIAIEPARPVELGKVRVGADGAATVSVKVPPATKLGLYAITATAGDVTAADWVLVLPKQPGGPAGPGGPGGPGNGPGGPGNGPGGPGNGPGGPGNGPGGPGNGPGGPGNGPGNPGGPGGPGKPTPPRPHGVQQIR